ncbi:hypothetical protein EI555_007491 [Monodon monoceros]|uniref:medium-chain acyl-CoA ligase n=1 Tax=Monodon monoceros TaxID=40151 RepID=A0A4U1EII0_MONMO|nr:hypothetical protein EI555_007491 [Monodon monoceros]
MTQKDILYRLPSSKSKCIFTNDVLAPAVDGVASKCENLHSKLIVSQSPREGWENLKEMMKHASDNNTCVKTKHNETMAIFFTSGTSGSPKMTRHTHSSFGLGLSINGRFWLDLTPSDVMWNTSDIGWAKSAWSSVYSPWIQGACVFAHYLPRFEPTSVLQTLCKFPITVFCSAPTADRILVQNDKTRNYKFKSLKHCVSAGESVNSEVTEQWRNRTGLDIHEGYGQTETVLICGNFKGMKIKPGSMGSLLLLLMLNALTEHSTLAELAVVSSPDPIRGEKSNDQKQLKKEIQEHVKRATAPYKYPRKVEFIQELPKTISGKIRNELRKKEWETI